MAGAIGGIVGGLVSNVAGGLLSNLISSFGSNMLGGALGNLFTGAIGKAVNAVVDQLPLPNFLKDMAKGVVDQVIGGAQDKTVSPDCECAAKENFGDMADSFEKDLTDTLMDGVMKNFEEETKKDGKGGKRSEGENWLVALAKTMSDIQNEHLNKMLDASDKMADNVGEGQEEREAFIDAQSEFQARSKLFGMASEATSTALKTIGDAMSSLARKQ